jgi:hypothetical protein
VYEVSALASASVGLATLAVAELHAARSGSALPAVTIEREHAAAAFGCERHLAAVGWQLPAVWDPLAGDYACQDGYIRLHTNYTHHRDAVLRVVGTAPERKLLQEAVASWSGAVLEDAVVAAGGCAALLRSPSEWREHPQGRAVAATPLFEVASTPCETPPVFTSDAAPLAGIRVLDLTRVMAGPVCTRFLAAWGADVLRIDPPGFEEVGALLAEMTTGKRRAALDLRRESDRARFEALVREADVIVHGYRSNALAGLGYDDGRLRQWNPNAAIVTHDTYGFSGPWTTRRGFDSLVQMSCGIAWRGREALGSDKPQPLPVQALDHATGYLLAAAACRAVTRRLCERQTSAVRTSLARVAQVLIELGDRGDPRAPALSVAQVEPWLESADTAFGPVRRVRSPGQIAGLRAHWARPAGPLGSDPAVWQIA